MLAQDFYDQDGTLVKSLRTLEVAEMGGRVLAVRQRMEKVDAGDEWTEIHVKSMTFDLDLSGHWRRLPVGERRLRRLTSSKTRCHQPWLPRILMETSGTTEMISLLGRQAPLRKSSGRAGQPDTALEAPRTAQHGHRTTLEEITRAAAEVALRLERLGRVEDPLPRLAPLLRR